MAICLKLTRNRNGIIEAFFKEIDVKEEVWTMVNIKIIFENDVTKSFKPCIG